jgi:hypothetical protein
VDDQPSFGRGDDGRSFEPATIREDSAALTGRFQAATLTLAAVHAMFHLATRPWLFETVNRDTMLRRTAAF